MSTPYLPFFVYGTLIPGQPNDHLVQGRIIAQEPATFSHGRLWAFPTFPMLEETTTGHPVQGVLLTLDPAHYEQAVQELDELEEYDPLQEADSPYLRRQRTVFTAAGQAITAWVYVGQTAVIPPHLPLIESGDWVAHVAAEAEQDTMAKWWRERGADLLFGKTGHPHKNSTDA